MKKKKVVDLDHNPLPKRREHMTREELIAASILAHKERKRNAPKSRSFSSWEYADRYLHRKTS